MAFEDTFRMSAHAAIFDSQKRVLLLKATYGNLNWGLPGGALEPGETIHEALVRECKEELGCEVTIEALTGVYYHKAFNSQVFIFKCRLEDEGTIHLSPEHSEFRYHSIEELSAVQRQRIGDCIEFNGYVRSAKF